MVNAASMAGTWFLFAILVRIPTTRRFCLKDPRGLAILRLAFCMLWMIGRDLQNYDSDKMETCSGCSPKDSGRNVVMHYGGTLARALGFMCMSSRWMNLKVKGWSRQVAIVDPESSTHRSLPQEDPDLSHHPDSQSDEKPPV
ncbi:hypothetical protein BDR04DRAFT_1091935 [Suillus decipiens]|nr:hypothetical protein BDR04DRAFT_1098370 [Suillus decipiens]KAG2075092.1 hypothetical protein BDR04DRAFT_1091935 [Suillus decipiens]